MSLRYQRKERFDQRAGVTTFRGVDPLTGLPVLIYEFEGEANPNLEALESEHIPGILAITKDQAVNQVVVAYASGYAPLAQPLGDLEGLLIGSAQALADAAAAGVPHGDIKPERFWVSGEHVLVEGFGLPWQIGEGASLEGDVKNWAESLRSVLSATPPELDGLLRRCTGDAGARPTAAELLSDVKGLELESTVASTDQPLSPKTLHDIDIDFSVGGFEETSSPGKLDEVELVVTDTSSGAARLDEAVTTGIPPQALALGGIRDVSKSSASAGAAKARTGQRPPRSGGPDPRQTFVKDLPPGATYRAGSAEAAGKAAKPAARKPGPAEPRPKAFEDVFDAPKKVRSGGPPWGILIAVLIGAITLGGLAFVLQGRTGFTVAPAEAQYLVEVNIAPANLPPAQLYVVQSPEGSRLPSGSGLSNYPSGRHQLVLDREGLWQLQARIQGVYPEDVYSEVVSLRLPEERSLTFTLPVPNLEPEEEDNDTP